MIIPWVLTVVIKILSDKISKKYLLYFFIVNSLYIFEPIFRKYGLEMMGNGYENGSFFYASNWLHYIVQVAFCLFYFININKVKDPKTRFFINMATLSSLFTLLSRNIVLYARLAYYFNVFHCLAISNVLLENNNKKEKRLIYYLIFLSLGVYYLLLTTKAFVQSNFRIDFINNNF